MDLRLIVPLRAGFLDKSAPIIARKTHLKHAVRGIELALELAEQDQAALNPVGLGAYFAHQFLRQQPQKVRQMIYLAAEPPKNRNVAPFFHGLSKLATSNQRLTNIILQYYMRNVSSPKNLMPILMQAFLNSPQDRFILERSFGPPYYGHHLLEFMHGSWKSMAQDYAVRHMVDWQVLNNLSKK